MTPNRLEGIVKTVRPSEVEMYTGSGWAVVGTFQDTLTRTVEELGDNAPFYTDSKGNCQPVPYGKTVIYRQVSETLTFFVLQKDSENVLSELRAKLDQANETLDTARAEHKRQLYETRLEYEKAITRLEESLKNATNGIEEEKLRKKIKELEVECADHVKSINQIKKDLDEARRESGVRRVDFTEDVELVG